MERKKTILSAIIVSGAVGLVVTPGWSQMKGSESPGSTPRSSAQKKDDATAPGGTSTNGMKSSDAMKDKQPGERAATGSWNKDDVKKVQEALKDKGNDPGPADGIMGPQTQKALRAFQSKQGIKSTGRLDAETAKALGVERASSMGSGPSSAPGSSTKESTSGMKSKEPASK